MTIFTSKIQRWVCLVVLVCFGLSLFPEAGLALPSLQMGARVETPRVHTIDIPSEIATVEEWYSAPQPISPKLIVHIQDAHSNYEAQTRIRDLLQYLNKTYGFKTILAEGAAEQLDSKYLKLFPDQAKNIQLVDALAKEGEATGAELFLMEHESAMQAEGIEKPELYRRNFDALQKVFNEDDLVKSFFEAYENKLGQIGSRTFSPHMIQALQEWRKFEAGHREFLPFANNLAKLAKQSLEMDLDKLYAQIEWPQLTRLLVLQRLEAELRQPSRDARDSGLVTRSVEQQAEIEKQEIIQFFIAHHVAPALVSALEKFDEKTINFNRLVSSDGRQPDAPRVFMELLIEEGAKLGFDIRQYPAFAKYAGYLIIRSEIVPGQLFAEIQKLFHSILDALAKEAPSTALEGDQSLKQRARLLQLYREEMLARKLLRLELNRDEWLQVLSHRNRFAPHDFARRLREVDGQNDRVNDVASTERDRLSEAFNNALEFYDAATAREDYFFQKMQDTLAKTDRAILITGGFHAEGMKTLMREHDINYGVVTPRLTQESTHDIYRKVMMTGSEVAQEPRIMNLVDRTHQRTAIVETAVANLPAAALSGTSDLRIEMEGAARSQARNQRVLQIAESLGLPRAESRNSELVSSSRSEMRIDAAALPKREGRAAAIYEQLKLITAGDSRLRQTVNTGSSSISAQFHINFPRIGWNGFNRIGILKESILNSRFTVFYDESNPDNYFAVELAGPLELKILGKETHVVNPDTPGKRKKVSINQTAIGREFLRNLKWTEVNVTKFEKRGSDSGVMFRHFSPVKGLSVNFFPELNESEDWDWIMPELTEWDSASEQLYPRDIVSKRAVDALASQPLPDMTTIINSEDYIAVPVAAHSYPRIMGYRSQKGQTFEYYRFVKEIFWEGGLNRAVYRKISGEQRILRLNIIRSLNQPVSFSIQGFTLDNLPIEIEAGAIHVSGLLYFLTEGAPARYKGRFALSPQLTKVAVPLNDEVPPAVRRLSIPIKFDLDKERQVWKLSGPKLFQWGGKSVKPDVLREKFDGIVSSYWDMMGLQIDAARSEMRRDGPMSEQMDEHSMFPQLQDFWPGLSPDVKWLSVAGKKMPVIRTAKYVLVGDYLFLPYNDESLVERQAALSTRFGDQFLFVNFQSQQGILKFEYGTFTIMSLLLMQANRELFRDRSVLDAGSGDGVLSLFAKKLGASRVRGIDLRDDLIRLARSLSRQNGMVDITFDVKSFEALTRAEDSADIVLANLDQNGLYGQEIDNYHYLLASTLQPKYYFLLGLFSRKLTDTSLAVRQSLRTTYKSVSSFELKDIPLWSEKVTGMSLVLEQRLLAPLVRKLSFLERLFLSVFGGILGFGFIPEESWIRGIDGQSLSTPGMMILSAGVALLGAAISFSGGSNARRSEMRADSLKNYELNLLIPRLNPDTMQGLTYSFTLDGFKGLKDRKDLVGFMRQKIDKPGRLKATEKKHQQNMFRSNGSIMPGYMLVVQNLDNEGAGKWSRFKNSDLSAKKARMRIKPDYQKFPFREDAKKLFKNWRASESEEESAAVLLRNYLLWYYSATDPVGFAAPDHQLERINASIYALETYNVEYLTRAVGGKRAVAAQSGPGNLEDIGIPFSLIDAFEDLGLPHADKTESRIIDRALIALKGFRSQFERVVISDAETSAPKKRSELRDRAAMFDPPSYTHQLLKERSVLTSAGIVLMGAIGLVAASIAASVVGVTISGLLVIGGVTAAIQFSFKAIYSLSNTSGQGPTDSSSGPVIIARETAIAQPKIGEMSQADWKQVLTTSALYSESEILRALDEAEADLAIVNTGDKSLNELRLKRTAAILALKDKSSQAKWLPIAIADLEKSKGLVAAERLAPFELQLIQIKARQVSQRFSASRKPASRKQTVASPSIKRSDLSASASRSLQAVSSSDISLPWANPRMQPTMIVVIVASGVLPLQVNLTLINNFVDLVMVNQPERREISVSALDNEAVSDLPAHWARLFDGTYEVTDADFESAATLLASNPNLKIDWVIKADTSSKVKIEDYQKIMLLNLSGIGIDASKRFNIRFVKQGLSGDRDARAWMGAISAIERDSGGQPVTVSFVTDNFSDQFISNLDLIQSVVVHENYPNEPDYKHSAEVALVVLAREVRKLGRAELDKAAADGVEKTGKFRRITRESLAPFVDRLVQAFNNAKAFWQSA